MTWVARNAVPVVLGVATFVAVGYLTGLAPRQGDSAAEAGLDAPVPPLATVQAPLQVAVHDLVESIPGHPTVRVCRALANRPVSVTTSRPESLRVVLEAFASQVRVELVLAASQSDARVLPTIPCPGGMGNYFVIGGEPGPSDQSRTGSPGGPGLPSRNLTIGSGRQRLAFRT